MKLKAIILFILFTKCGFSQYVDEALMYGRSGIFGTARTAGVGGAFGSVGADLGSMGINPAGLGLYRTTDFSITPGFQIGTNESKFDGSNSSINSSKLFLSQVGAAWTKIIKGRSGSGEINFNRNLLRSYTFAINYHRENFFARTENFSGSQTGNSMISDYTDYLNQSKLPITTDNYPVELVFASQLGLINLNTNTGQYVSAVRSIPMNQSGSIDARGGTNKLSIAFGGNMNDKVYFGLGVSVPFLSYTVAPSFTETNPNIDSSYFYSYTLNSRINVSGTGITGNLGLIYRPASWVRVGLAYQLPTWYAMSEGYASGMTVFTDSAAAQSISGSYPEPYRYKMRLPMKGTASASFFIKQYGFFSIDYDIQNMGSARFNFTDDRQFTADENAAVKATYGFNHTVRAGFEGAYKVLRLRVGYAFSSSPYKGNIIPSGYAKARANITAGIGVRLKSFYADFAYVLGVTKDVNHVYSAPDVQNRYATHGMLLTIGWKMSRQRNNEPVVSGAGGQEY